MRRFGFAPEWPQLDDKSLFDPLPPDELAAWEGGDEDPLTKNTPAEVNHSEDTMEFTVHEAKTQFSKLVHQAMAGEEIVITSGKERTKVVKLIAYEDKEKKPVRIGWLMGQIPDIGLDHPFFDPLPEEELRLWNGEGD